MLNHFESQIWQNAFSATKTLKPGIVSLNLTLLTNITHKRELFDPILTFL
jgi:hypothetical protein